MAFQTSSSGQIRRGLAFLALAAGVALAEPAEPPFREWGKETMEVLHKDLWLPEKKLYAEKADVEAGKPDHPAFMWGVGVQLTAMAAASTLEPDKYLSPMRDYADAIQVYWLKHDGIEGFDVQPGPKA